MSKKRKRSAETAAKSFEKILRDATDREPSADETKAVRLAIKDFITSEAGGAEVLFRFILKAISNHRQTDLKRKRAIILMDYTFQKSKEFRGIVCSQLRPVIKKCCRGSEDNVSDINNDPVALYLLQCVHQWNALFGAHYAELSMVCRYYTESVRVMDAKGVYYLYIYPSLYANTMYNILITSS